MWDVSERRNNEVNQFMRRIRSAPSSEVGKIACREEDLPQEGSGIYAPFSRLGEDSPYCVSFANRD